MTTTFVPAATNIPRAILSACLATALFTVMGAIIKWLSPIYPLAEIIFARNLFALVPLAPLLLRAGPAAFKTRRPIGHALRCGIGLVSTACSFTALDHLPLPNHVAITFTAPLFVTALAIPLLGEVVGWRRWLATVVGFAGVLIMVRPDGAAFLDNALFIGTLWGLAASFTYALVTIVMRQLSSTEASLTTVAYFTLAGILVGGAFLPFSFVMPTPRDAVLLALVGLLGGVGQVLITDAVRYGPTSIVAPFDYTGMLYALVIGWMVWSDVPSTEVLVGAAVITASGLFILHRETSLGVVRTRPAKLRTLTRGRHRGYRAGL